MATKKRKAKRGGGRHDHSGVLTGIKPGSEEWSDIRNRIIYGHPEWRMVRLRELIIEEGARLREWLTMEGTEPEKLEHASKLPDNFLSARAEANRAALQTMPPDKRYFLLNEMDSLWRDVAAQIDRAVLDSDADCFKRLAAAMQRADNRTEWQKERAHFNAEVIRRLESAFWSTHSKKGDNREDAILTPAGKFTDAKARQILESFHPRKDTKPLTDKEKKFIRWHEDERWNHAEIEDMIGKSYTRNKDSELIAVSKRGGALIVEWENQNRTQKFSHRFQNERCALDAIRDIANQLQIELKKQKRSTL
jgi:hypothetical protein